MRRAGPWRQHEMGVVLFGTFYEGQPHAFKALRNELLPFVTASPRGESVREKVTDVPRLRIWAKALRATD